MTLMLDTFLVALYTVVDDLYQAVYAPQKPRRRGHQPEMSDSEVLTLLLLAQWLGWSERMLVAYAAACWRAYFPRLVDQSAFNRRARDLVGVLVHLVPQLATLLQAEQAPYQVFDGVPVPLLRCCRGQYHRLFGTEASIGKGGSDHRWYYGCQLLVAATAQGVITGFLLGPAATEGHWLGEAFLCWRHDEAREPWDPADLPPSHRRGGSYRGATGPLWPRAGVGAAAMVPYVTDGGFRGEQWIAHWQAGYQACVLDAGEARGEHAEAVRREHAGWRQVIEQVNEHLTHGLHLAYPGARTTWGLLTRVAAKLVAYNLAICINRLLGRPDRSFATLFTL